MMPTLLLRRPLTSSCYIGRRDSSFTLRYLGTYTSPSNNNTTSIPSRRPPSPDMSSFVNRLRGGGSDPESDPVVQQERDKYRLLVTAGPAYDQSTHKIVRVNTEIPTVVENEFMTAKIVVRVKGFRGLPSSSPGTAEEYFQDPMHSRDQYSLGFTFVPKKDIESLDTVWGNDLDHSIRLVLWQSAFCWSLLSFC